MSVNDLENTLATILEGKQPNTGASGETKADKIDTKGDPLAKVTDIGGPTPEKDENEGGDIKSGKSAKGLNATDRPKDLKGKDEADHKKVKKEAKDDDKKKDDDDDGDNVKVDVNIDTDDDDDDDDDSDDDKKGFKKGKKVEVEEITFDADDINIDVKEDIEALVKGEELSEDFKTKTQTIFEAAVRDRVISECEKYHGQFKEQFESQLDEAKAEQHSTLVDQIDSYLTYVTQEWMKENEVAIDSGLKTNITESLVKDLKEAFSSNYVDIPDDKTDLFEELATKVGQLEEDVNDQMNKNIQLTEAIKYLGKQRIVKEALGEMTETDKEKVESLLENVTFTTESEFRVKLNTIIESYTGVTIVDENIETDAELVKEEIVNDVEVKKESKDPDIASAANFIKRTQKFQPKATLNEAK